jgi:hypothetical protein
MPKKMIATRIVRCIAFSCIGKRYAELRRSLAMQDNARTFENENEV